MSGEDRQPDGIKTIKSIRVKSKQTKAEKQLKINRVFKKYGRGQQFLSLCYTKLSAHKTQQSAFEF